MAEQQDNVLIVPSVAGTPVELAIAGPGGRAYAFIIDWHIRLAAAVVVGLAMSYLSAGAGASVYLQFLPSALVYFLYHPVIEVLMSGSTPGKRFAGVRIVDYQGGVPTTGALLIRNIFRLVDSLPALYLVGLVTAIVSARHVRFGDLAAGTLLVYEARNRADVFDELAQLSTDGPKVQSIELAREVLQRWGELDDATRISLGTRILAGAGVDGDFERSRTVRAALKTLVS